MFATTESPEALESQAQKSKGKPLSDAPVPSNSAAVAEFPLAKGRQAWRQWLTRSQELTELKVEYDSEDAALWCQMAPKGRPSVTPGLAQESRTLQRSIQELWRSFGPEDELPIRYGALVREVAARTE